MPELLDTLAEWERQLLEPLPIWHVTRPVPRETSRVLTRDDGYSDGFNGKGPRCVSRVYVDAFRMGRRDKADDLSDVDDDDDYNDRYDVSEPEDEYGYTWNGDSDLEVW